MKFFSGFCFQNEKDIFKDYIEEVDFKVAGFSYGAIKAFEYVLNSKERIDKLQLFSPAFFQEEDEKFKKLQLIYFKKDPALYTENFLKNVIYPSSFKIEKFKSECFYEDLKDLLYYQWERDKLSFVRDKNTKIEVFLGEKDKITNSLKAKEFFKEFSTLYFIKDVGHILK